MSREWKPGDVALVRMETNEHGGYFRGPAMFCRGGWMTEAHWGVDAEVVRPLVVIDPEDGEQVARLARLLRGAEITAPAFRSMDRVKLLATALREFANPTPPKPEQPTGLGAVVEDAEGRRWTRVDAVGPDTASWMRERSSDIQAWDRVPVVRVLSEGVTP